MEMQKELNYVKLVSQVFKNAHHSEMSDDFFTKNDQHLEVLGQYFQVTKNQAFLMCLFLNLNYKNDLVDIFDLGDYLDCPALNLLQLKSDFDQLEEKNYISKTVSNHRINLARANNQYCVSDEISQCVINSRPILINSQQNQETNEIMILEKICNIFEIRNKINNKEKESYSKIIKTLIQYQEKPFFNWLINLDLEPNDLLCFLYLIWKTLNDTEETQVSHHIKDILSNKTEIIKYLQKFALKTNSLFKNELIESYKNRGNSIIKLSGLANRKLIQLELLPDEKGVNSILEDELSFFEKIDEIYTSYEDSNTSSKDHLADIETLVVNHQKFPIIKYLSKLKFEKMDFYMLLFLIGRKLSGKTKVDVDGLLKRVTANASEKLSVSNQLKSKKHELMKHELIEMVPASFFNENCLELTKKCDLILKKQGIPIFVEDEEEKGLITSTSIAKKQLFYADSEIKQIETISNLLSKGNLTNIQKRLNEKALPTGVNILLYGAPGTGKTESVYQIAKKTGRNIMKVEISQTKSMWFGESEKLIKGIFDKYNELLKKSTRAPILLFNEADAIIAKRKTETNAGTSQTENAIQNILLEELENFKGILFATTNLQTNLDNAFERRFLFKVKFDLPSNDVKSKIWKNRIPFLSKKDAVILSEKFQFSGGQIENVVRKIEINELLHSCSPNLETIVQFCQEELLSNVDTYSIIGFK